MALPTPTSQFVGKKTKIISQLSVPDSDYADASPKGSVDVGIRDLIEEINAVDGLVTTSSCAGRVSVYVEGRKTTDGDERQVAGVGGKGAGGTWLFVSHEPVPDHDWIKELDLKERTSGHESNTERRLIHFKFEPMVSTVHIKLMIYDSKNIQILHILTTSPHHAQLILRCALQAGFRESGALNLTSADDQPTPMVGIRSMGLSFESLIGHQINDCRELIVPPEYLHALMEIATERFAENTKRIDRFLAAFREALSTPVRRKGDGEEWEDTAARRERKRAEGLRRKAEVKVAKVKLLPDPEDAEMVLQAESIQGL